MGTFCQVLVTDRCCSASKISRQTVKAVKAVCELHISFFGQNNNYLISHCHAFLLVLLQLHTLLHQLFFFSLSLHWLSSCRCNLPCYSRVSLLPLLLPVSRSRCLRGAVGWNRCVQLSVTAALKRNQKRVGDVEKEKETKKEGKKCFKLVWRGKEGSGQVEISRWGEMSL